MWIESVLDHSFLACNLLWSCSLIETLILLLLNATTLTTYYAYNGKAWTWQAHWFVVQRLQPMHDAFGSRLPVAQWLKSKMATKRKVGGEMAIVPAKRPKQNQIALADQGRALQAVRACILLDILSFLCVLWADHARVTDRAYRVSIFFQLPQRTSALEAPIMLLTGQEVRMELATLAKKFRIM